MTSTFNRWRANRSQLIALVGAGVAVASLLLNIGFFFGPGVGEVLRGLAHHAFILGWMLILTSRSRTVSLGTLGIFWLLGVWGVYALAYVIERPLASQFGAEITDEFVPVWLAPLTEEAAKLLPVALFYLLSIRSGRQPAMSDGLLLGFMVGAGVSFHEDAHIGSIQLSGDGWGTATPWSAIFPTVSVVGGEGGIFALNHALWASLSGLSLGVAVMLRHWRLAWPIALIGPALGLTNHVMLNHFAGNLFGLLGRGDVPWFYDQLRALTDGGRLPMLVLVAGAVAVAVVEWLILRPISRRDRVFRPLSIVHVFRLLTHCASMAAAAQMLAAERYACLRHAVYFGAWRTRLVRGHPEVSGADFAQLVSLAARLEILPASAAAPAEAPAPGAEGASAVPEPAKAPARADAPADGA